MKTRPPLFPARWAPGPHFKKPIAAKVTKGLERRKVTAAEDDSKRAVRLRDGFCRFPLCGCKRFNLARAVCHSRHKGMGGNPKGDRSKPPLMILLCSARHRENVISVDRGTLVVTALTDKGLGGPCSFWIDPRALAAGKPTGRERWIEVGRETGALHQFEPFTPAQQAILDRLAKMDI